MQINCSSWLLFMILTILGSPWSIMSFIYTSVELFFLKLKVVTTIGHLKLLSNVVLKEAKLLSYIARILLYHCKRRFSILFQSSKFILISIVMQVVMGMWFMHFIMLLILAISYYWCSSTWTTLNCVSLKNSAVLWSTLNVIWLKHITWSNSIDTQFSFFNRKCVMQIFVKDKDFIQFSHLLQAISIQLACLCKISRLNWKVLKTIQLQEIKELSVATVSEHSFL